MSMLLTEPTTGGIPVAPGGAVGGLVTGPGQVQYGSMLLGAGTNAGWRDLTGWRDTPNAQVSDTDRPQAHGSYAGDVWGDSITVTFTYLLRGTTESKLAALATLERNLPLDGVERPLVINDGGGPTVRMGRVIQRTIPMTKAFRVGPLECVVQWLCADPRRYDLTTLLTQVGLGMSTGGLAYPLAYPLTYGTSLGGSRAVLNNGSTSAPMVATFIGPLVNPTLTSDQGWSLAFKITLAAGEFLQVDTGDGSALLNGATDRLYTIDTLSSPIERCSLPVGTTRLALAAAGGTGAVNISSRNAYL